MQDLNDLHYFVQVVDHGGFAPAGRALGVPKSKLSRRLALLEERLGVRLAQRSTRKFVVTEAGQAYYRHAKAALLEAAAAEEAVARKQGEPRGVVRMSCPTTLLEVRVGRRPVLRAAYGRTSVPAPLAAGWWRAPARAARWPASRAGAPSPASVAPRCAGPGR